MRHLRTTIILAASIVVPISAIGRPPDSSLGDPAQYSTVTKLTLLNEFLVYASKDDPSFRKSPKVLIGSEPVPDGYLEAHSGLVGRFAYIPKSFNDLTPYEQSLVLGDARWLRYANVLQSKWDMNGDRPRKADLAAAAELPPASPKISLISIELNEEELLDPNPIIVCIPRQE